MIRTLRQTESLRRPGENPSDRRRSALPSAHGPIAATGVLRRLRLDHAAAVGEG